MPDRSSSRALLAGAASVVLGLSQTVTAQQEQQHIFTLNGELASTRFGYGLDNAGDVDKDGIDDIVVGADWGSATYRAGSVWIHSGKDGRLLQRWVGDGQDDRLGTWVSGAGDVDGDGHADVIAGAHLDDNNGTNSGMIRVFSGKTGAVLWSIDGAQAGARFGECVDAGGDVDKDGTPDFVVGAPQDGLTLTSKEGSVTVISGKTGKEIWKRYGDRVNDQLGRAVCSIGDINLDGYADFAAGSQIVDNFAVVDAGLCRIYSGKDGTVLKDLYGAQTDVRLGGFIQAGDLNKDNFPDIFVYAPRDTTGNLTQAGSVTVFSGINIALNIGNPVLFKLYGTIDKGGFGHSLGFAGDVNGDGFGDLLVGQPTANLAPGGTAFVYSGKDGSLIYKFIGDGQGDNRGNFVAGAGDINGDGFADILTSAMWDDNTVTDAGSVTLWSGKALTLAADQHLLSLAKANTQNLAIDVGAAHAGRSYWLFGSVSGTAPGINLGSVHIPLNPDPWTDIVMGLTNTPAFVTTRGTLDGSGKGAMQIKLGPAPTASGTGLVLHHACLVFDAAGIHAATNATSLLVVK